MNTALHVAAVAGVVAAIWTGVAVVAAAAWSTTATVLKRRSQRTICQALHPAASRHRATGHRAQHRGGATC